MRQRLLGSLLILSSVLTACGGGGGVTTPLATTLGGTAATGAAIDGGTVDAVCASGIVPSTTTDALGAYRLDTTSATYPCVVRVSIPGTTNYLYSIAENGATKANLTPLTNLLSDLLFGANSATVFANFSSSYAQSVTTSNISTAQQKVVSALSALGIDVSNYEFLKATFTPATENADGDDLDKKLDQLTTTLLAADKTLSDLSTAINNASNSPQTIGSITATAVGTAAKSLTGCPYVRGGGYWTFSHDGSSFSRWTIDLDAMTATLYGTANSYPVAVLTESNATVPCAFTITKPDSVVTAYFSKSGIFGWKQQMTAGEYYFGLGVPVQTSTELTNSNFAGTYPLLGYLSYQNSASKYQSALPMQIQIDTSGNTKTASCSLINGAPVCDALTSSSGDNMNCGANSQGIINCTSTDGNTTAKMFAFISQQEPTIFMLMSGNVSGLPYSALIVGTKSRKLKLPSVGTTQSSSTGWYFSRAAQVNPNTSWTFNSGETSSGTSTTVTSVSTANGSYTTGNGRVWFMNLPIDGEYWVPTVTNSTFPSGSNQMLTMTSNGGWQMRVTGRSSATSFNDFNGIEFYIRKP